VATTTRAPTGPGACASESGATFWVYGPTKAQPIRRLANNTVTCLAHPYNVAMVRPTCAAAAAVRLRLVKASGTGTGTGPRVVHKSQAQSGGAAAAQVYLFGTAAAARSRKALPNGRYYLTTRRGAAAGSRGRLLFTQSCPCPDGNPTGKKGCMKL
jgi:hypothetical protein